MFRRSTWYGLIASAILMALTVSAVSAATYTDPKGRFTVAIPSGWETEKQPDPFTALYVGPNGRRLAFGIIATDEPVPGDSAHLIQNIVDQLGDAFDESDTFTIQATTLGGLPAERADGRGQIGNQSLRITLIASVVRGTTYVLLFMAAESEYPAAAQTEKAIFDSFAFRGAPVVAPPTTAQSPAPTGIIHRLGDG